MIKTKVALGSCILALVLTGCGGGGGSSSTNTTSNTVTGSTCNDISGTYSITESLNSITCTSGTTTFTASDTSYATTTTDTITQSGCTATVNGVVTGTVSGSTWTGTETLSGTDATLGAYSGTLLRTVSGGSSVSGSGVLSLSYPSSSVSCSGTSTITGTKQ